MSTTSSEGLVVVTGAAGHIGREVLRLLRTTRLKIEPVDVDPGKTGELIRCDLRLKNDVVRLFQNRSVQAVIHLAGILPSAFHSNPLSAVDVNLSGCFELMRQAVNARVKRFIFASSMSVYGSSFLTRTLTEDDPAAPDEPYGASKRVVELVGEALAHTQGIEFVSLRIARVIGPGIKKTSSPWRSQMFEGSSGGDPIQIPFAPEAMLSLVHVEDVARMLVILVQASELRSSIYNTPVEVWKATHLKEIIEEVREVRVDLGPNGTLGGPICDGSRFTREFGFRIRGLRERLTTHPARLE